MPRILDRAPLVPLIVLAIYAAGPLLVLGFNALKAGPEIAINPFGPPLAPSWENFTEAWEQGRFGTTLRNSLLLVGLVVPGVLLVSFPAAYVLARRSSRGVDALVTYLLIASTIPVQLYLLPLFVFFSRNGLMNSLPALAVIYVAKFSPLATFLLRAFLLKTPVELEDAARLDGASEGQLFTRILVPICAPVLLTVALITGLMVWNEFALAITFIHERELKTVATSLFAFQREHETDWSLTNAGAVITLLGPLVLFFFLQRRFIDGLTAGAVKS